jgi:hypothetical protein
MVNRVKMCKHKVSFTTIASAQKRADKHGQRVYECPICFCFHCTSKENWRDEFVEVEKYRNILKDNERLQSSKQKSDAKRKNLKVKINELERVLKAMKKENAALKLKIK